MQHRESDTTKNNQVRNRGSLEKAPEPVLNNNTPAWIQPCFGGSTASQRVKDGNPRRVCGLTQHEILRSPKESSF